MNDQQRAALSEPLASKLREDQAMTGEGEQLERLEKRWYATTATRLSQSGAEYRVTTGDPNGGALLEVDLGAGRMTLGMFPQHIAEHALHWAVEHDQLCKIAVAALYENSDFGPLEEVHKAITATVPIKQRIKVRIDMVLNTEQEAPDIARKIRDMVNARALSLDVISSVVQVEPEKVVV